MGETTEEGELRVNRFEIDRRSKLYMVVFCKRLFWKYRNEVRHLRSVSNRTNILVVQRRSVYSTEFSIKVNIFRIQLLLLFEFCKL